VIVTLVPAYGRDYSNKADVQAAYAAGLDFINVGYNGNGQLINRTQVEALGASWVNIRYGRLRKVLVIDLVKGGVK
jgi:phosphoglycolate phosphatase-like HAD superfamily hydrolase